MQALQSKAPVRPESLRDDHPPRARPARVPHACDRCRLMRTKCSGGERCSKCTKDDTVCEYGDGKREKNKRDLLEGRERITSLSHDKSELLQDNIKLLTLLRNISCMEGFPAGTFPEVSDILARASAREVPVGEDPAHSKRSIRDRATGGSSSAPSIFETPHRSSESIRETSDSTRVGEAYETAGDVGSPGKQGELSQDVDLEYGGGAAGFIGKASPISWVQRCKEHLGSVTSPPLLHNPIETTQTQLDQHDAAANRVNYYLDDADLLSVDEDIMLSEDIPSLEVAYLLAEACFHSQQGAFNFIYRGEFLSTLAKFPSNRPRLSWRQRQWLAMANIVFAIGVRWLHHTQMDEVVRRYNHIEFYARARALGLDHRVVFDHPSLEQVQALGLLGFYLYINGSIARAWTITGHALRHATALGLHLRVADASISLLDRLRRARTWYSLYNLEILISETTGRPKAITPDDITVLIEDAAMAYPVLDALHRTPQIIVASESWVAWQAFLLARRRPTIGSEDNKQIFRELPPYALESVSLTQFSQRIRLCLISHRVGSALYSAAAGLQSWSDFQTKLASLDAAMLAWRQDLPQSIRISPKEIQASGSDPRPQIELALYYQSVRMILHRPCICKIDIMHESARSKEFNVKSARACIRGAVSILELMPDVNNEHDAQEVFQLVPWWAALHYVAQSASILMLEMAINCEHLAPEEFRQDQQQLVTSLRKAMAYLYLLSATSRSAEKAWTIFQQLYEETMALYPGI